MIPLRVFFVSQMAQIFNFGRGITFVLFSLIKARVVLLSIGDV